MFQNFKKVIGQQFKKPSGLFGIFTSNLMIKENMPRYDMLIKDLDIQPHDKILEIGYGPGIGIELISEKCDSCIIHGIDFSKLMYKRATKRNKQHIESHKLLLKYGDIFDTQIEQHDYDKIFCLNVVYFWDDLQKAFKKIASLLKNSGSFCIYMATKEMLLEKKAPDGIFNKYSIEQITDALKLAGLNNIIYHFDKGYYIKAKK